MRPLDLLFGRFIHTGSIRVIDHAGHRADYGDGSAPAAVVRFTHAAAEWRALLAPEFHLMEAFTEGTLVVEDGSFYDFIAICGLNLNNTGLSAVHRLREALARAFLWAEHYNPAHLAKKRISHHYDLKEELFRLFLDTDLQYSCAYFPHPGTSLEEAQEAKKRHIAAKLRLEDGQRILDIGSGWGGLALTLARLAKIEVLGITLSEEQLAVSRRRAAEAGLADRVRFELVDYRRLGGSFDRIVSVGMFEHVGPLHYRRFFRQIHHLLAENGVALVHSIGDMHGSVTNPWIRRRIFPGAYIPALSQALKAVEKAGLLSTDVEVLRLHYAETLRAWRQRFMANRAQMAELYDERFCRMWEAYLSACEAGFRHMGSMVFQLQVARRADALPLTRDYMVEQERSWAASERQAAE